MSEERKKAEQELDNLEKQFDTLAIQANDRIKATEAQLAKARELLDRASEFVVKPLFGEIEDFLSAFKGKND